ncbi:MAG TPA: ankyrin repeat domain-containing protein [Actinomycetota bacterium]|jgi:ankyrin repeat protein
MASSDDLFDAIDLGDGDRVRFLLAEDPALAGARDPEGVSALMRARYRGEPAIVNAIRGLGVPADGFEAAAFGEVDRLGALLDADPALVTSYSADGFTPLHFAAFFGDGPTAALLLERGAEVEARGRGWMTGTALHSAAASRNADVVELLLRARADPDARQGGGWTPLHGAAHNGDARTVGLLLEAGADPAARNDEGRSVLELAEERGDPATIDRVRRALDATGT